MDYAAKMAQALDARASVIACAVIPRMPQRILGDTLIGISGMVREEGRKSEQDAKRLVSLFAEAAGARGLTMGDRFCPSGLSSEVPKVLAQYARLHDLAILPMPEGDYVSRFDAQWYAETVMFDSGLPAMILPERPASDPGRLDTVVVAWDKSRAAARSIADAIPVLRNAKNVRLLTVQGEKHVVEEPSSSLMVNHLERHDVHVAADEVQAGDRTIGEVLKAHVHSLAADLLIMGAYGHSRFREFVLGGATKSMLTHPPCPLFMSH
ncbi:MAG: universal stress protein [Proteobacteria bacterium]|nr:universal stress protein [Pseudomonadota bacterium]